MEHSFSKPLVIVGGGLAGSLLAYRYRELFPQAPMVLLEQSDRLGGNHTWSFHQSDLSPYVWRWLEPLVSHSWPNHEVQFPAFRRTMAGAYHSIRSRDLDRKIRQTLGASVKLGVSVGDVHAIPDIAANSIVVDARGFVADFEKKTPCGFQKFVGVTYRYPVPHGIRSPILMDATVEQLDGYRFLYVLPWTETECLFEDTMYSDTSALDFETVKKRIAAYAPEGGVEIESEAGVLPIPLSRPQSAPANSLCLGVRAGSFHEVTGYSLPWTVRTIDAWMQRWPSVVESATTGSDWRSRYHLVLNRMLFRAARPERRYEIFQRFYRLPEDLIERFYSGRLTRRDAARILIGKPPVPILSGLRAIVGAKL